jgi:hypothetical protein
MQCISEAVDKTSSPSPDYGGIVDSGSLLGLLDQQFGEVAIVESQHEEDSDPANEADQPTN